MQTHRISEGAIGEPWVVINIQLNICIESIMPFLVKCLESRSNITHEMCALLEKEFNNWFVHVIEEFKLFFLLLKKTKHRS